MQSTTRHSCLPRLIAAFMVAYAFWSEARWLLEWWRGVVSIGHPVPSTVVDWAAYVRMAILLLWVLLSFFVWRRHSWARWFVAFSAMLLGVVHCVSYTDMLRQYGSFGLVSEALLLALPMFFLSAVVFCPSVGETFYRDEHGVSQGI